MLLWLDHPYLRVGEGAILLTTPLLRIIRGVVRWYLRRGHYRGRAILLTTIQCS